ncbi:MAG: helix-turn-helix transcriptional regulator [Nitrospiraceae bacterium]
MPRNDQVTRQWHIMQRLASSRQGLTLGQLAESLSAEFPKHLRTLRRDLAALEAANFPLVSERVDGRVRWRFMNGFRNVPALNLSPTELMALVFSRHLLSPLAGTELQTSLDSAFNKASAMIPPAARTYLQQLQNAFSVGLGPHKQYKQHRATIDALTGAMIHKQTVQMRYYSASRDVTSRREIDPYCLRYVDGALYLIAHCHRRKEPRMFAVERIRSLTLTDHPYQMPMHFKVDDYVEDALVVMRGKQIVVELVFEKSTAAWVKDRTWHPSQKLTMLKGGQLRMTLTVADTRELIGWILSFGSGVQVVEPDSLRAAVEKEARAILDRE